MKELSPQISSADKREYGIDLVKIISTFLVIMTHLYTFGGFRDSLEPWTFKYFCAIFFQAVSLCCVNLFGFSTGYLYFNKKIKLSRIIYLWFQVFFISVILFVVFTLKSKNFNSVNLSVIKTFFPLINRSYWFFTAYVILFALINVYNRIIEKMSQKAFIVFLVFMTFLLVILPLFYSKDLLSCKRGYSFVWLSFLYFFGVYFRKYDAVRKSKTFICAAVAVIMLLAVPLYGSFYSSHPFTFGDVNYREAAINYNSVTILIASIMLFFIISKIKIKNSAVKRITVHFSSVSFLVYIAHCNSYVMSEFVKNRIGYFSGFSAGIMLSRILLHSLMIYIPCAIFSLLLIKLFQLMKVDRVCDNIENFIKNFFYKVIRRNSIDG